MHDHFVPVYPGGASTAASPNFRPGAPMVEWHCYPRALAAEGPLPRHFGCAPILALARGEILPARQGAPPLPSRFGSVAPFWLRPPLALCSRGAS
eukprot:5172159-Pyramimonas_sp.AAC.1